MDKRVSLDCRDPKEGQLLLGKNYVSVKSSMWVLWVPKGERRVLV